MRYSLNIDVIRAKVKEQSIQKWWLAERLDITYRTLARWFSGEIKTVDQSSIEKLCEILETSIPEITVKKEFNEFKLPDDRNLQSKIIKDITEGKLDRIDVILPNKELTGNLLKALLSDKIPPEDSATIISKIIHMSLKDADFETAINYCNSLVTYDLKVKNYSRLIMTYGFLALANASISRIDKATKCIRKIRELKDHVDKEVYAKLKLMLSSVYVNYNRADLVSKSLDEETIKILTSKDERIALININLNRGVSYLKDDKFKEAKENLLKAQDLSKNLSLYLLFYTKLYLMFCEAKLGNMDESDSLEAELKEFPEKDILPNTHTLYYFLGIKHIMKENYEKAEKFLKLSEEEALNIHPDLNPFLYLLYVEFLSLAELVKDSEKINFYKSKVQEHESKCQFEEAKKLELL